MWSRGAGGQLRGQQRGASWGQCDYIYVEEAGEGSGMGLCLICCILGHKNKKCPTKYFRLNIKIVKKCLNYAEKVVVLNWKAFINFKITEGQTYLPSG
jgi:hypothetical protein